jgi:SAM-dependent methyltransferase
MQRAHLSYLVCPVCQSSLNLTEESYAANGRIDSGSLECSGCSSRYLIERGVARFVPMENYASGFGLQWRKHARTQYDSQMGRPISATRLFAETQWSRSMAGELILEAGSGSGRFTEVIASTGAMVVSFDYSVAVEANYASNGHRENVLIIQADIYQMPFRRAIFDRVCCLGVLQHTPDPQRAFAALRPMVKPGGWLAIDVYRKPVGIRRLTSTKYLVRPLTVRIPPERLYKYVERYVRTLWPITRYLPRRINWRLLIADYRGVYDLPNDTLRELAILDTFDMLAPAYDIPQHIGTVRKWFADNSLEDWEVQYGYNGIEGRGRAPVSPTPAS